MRPPSPAVPVALLLALLTPAIAACGEEERTGLLSQSRAGQLKASLADVQEAVGDGSCVRVREEVDGLRTRVEELPRRTDPDLRTRLEEGVAHLEEIAPAECEEQEETTETQPETTPETLPETTTEPVPTEPVPTEPAPTEPAPTPTEPVPPADGETPGNGNGNNGNGNGNGGNDDDVTGQGGAVAPEG